MAVLHGCSHFDTAEVYVEVPAGATATNVTTDADIRAKRNEALLGDFFRRARLPRDAFTVATKFAPGLHGPIEEDTSYGLAAVSTMLEASLDRLGLDYVDVLYLHRMPHSFTLLATWLESARAMIVEGKVRYIGLSEVSAAWLRRAHRITPISVVQLEWSLTVREPEAEIVPACVELGVGVVAYAPLARSLLLRLGAPPPNDYRGSKEPRFTGANWEANQRVAAKLTAFAEKRGMSPAQLMLGWLYERARHLNVTVVPIPGSTSRAHVADNIGAVHTRNYFTSLDMDELNAIGALVKGARAREEYLQIASGADWMQV
jgi:aryl-alcohol dehydrogenase-like predicted oxidoreductase